MKTNKNENLVNNSNQTQNEQTKWNGSEPHPDYIQQVKKETIDRYLNLINKIGRKQELINVYDNLKYDFDLEFHEITEWYREDKEELPKLYKLKDEIEKKIKITHN